MLTPETSMTCFVPKWRLFVFDFVLTMDAFNKVKDRLLEFFNANDDENIGSKYQALVNKTHP